MKEAIIRAVTIYIKNRQHISSQTNKSKPPCS